MPVPKNKFEKYGLHWDKGTSRLKIEFWMIRQGEEWLKERGLNLFEHYRSAQALLWPEDDEHRWAMLALRAFCESNIIALMGPADCGKTYPSAKFALVDYWVYPDKTLVLVSSTDLRGLELRIWGALKDLFNRAKERYSWLNGVVLETLHCITTDKLGGDDGKARVLRKGIICIPCMQGGRYVGLGKYVGVKQVRLRQIADECQLMSSSFLDAVPNYLGKDYKGIFLGNPLDTMDPLGRVAEPEVGWDALPEPVKTTTWKTRFYGGRCVNFIGTDSPNFEFPRDEPIRYPYLISHKKIEAVEQFWGPDSLQFYSQCKGVMKQGLLARRVITKALCEQHRAFEKAVWAGSPRTKIYGIDPAYGGDDRCVGMMIEFGEEIGGKDVMKLYPPEIIPVSIKLGATPEDQIARYAQQRLEAENIPATNCFYDSWGRGTLGNAFSRHFGATVPIPVDFGARPSPRPVRHDLFVQEENGEKRLKRCDEHFSKFVTELWFSARYVIECDQMRELPIDVMKEGMSREYGIVRGNKIEVEDKDDTRERMGRSPDLFDTLVVAIEGARQRNFQIKKLGLALTEMGVDSWINEAAEEEESVIKELTLQHA